MDTNRLNRLLADRFTDKGERQTVAAIIAALPPTMLEDRIVALVHEIARPAPEGQTPQQSADYIASFISAIGGMANEQQAFVRWIDAGGPGADIPEPAPAEPPEEADADPAGDDDDGTTIVAVDMAALGMPRPGPAPAGPTRADLQTQIRRHEADMRAPQGSEAWRAYWQFGGDAEYRAALQALETAPAIPALDTAT